MADAAPPTPEDYLKAITKTADNMRFDASVHGKPDFNPGYTYDRSSLKQTFNDLAQMEALQFDQPGAEAGANKIPEALRDKVINLESSFKQNIKDIVQGDFKTSSFNKPLDDILESIKVAKANPAEGNDPAILDQLNAKISALKADALDTELKQMKRNLQLQNDINRQAAYAQLETDNKYKGTFSLFRANDWVNNTNNDFYTDEELGRVRDPTVAVTNQAQVHNGADGEYSKADSFYKVTKATDESGRVSYNATYSHVPKSNGRILAEELISLAAAMVRVVGTITLVIPILEVLSTAVAGLGYLLSGGKIVPPYSLPFTQLVKTGESLFDQRVGTTRGAVQAEMDLALRRGGSREITFNSRAEGRELNVHDLEKAVTYLDEMKKQSKYQAGAKGTAGQITNPAMAMNFQVTTNFNNKLRALASTTSPTADTLKLVESFYKSQHDGSMKGYDQSRFKEIIWKELENYQIAYARMEQQHNAKKDNANESTITTPGEGVSVITPGQASTATSTLTDTNPGTSVIMPTAPAATSTISLVEPVGAPAPSAPEQFSAAEQRAADKLVERFGPEVQADNLPDMISKASEIFKDKVDYAYSQGEYRYDGPEVGQVQGARDECAAMKSDIDAAISELSKPEIEHMEEHNQLKNYKDAVETAGSEPAPRLKEGASALGRIEVGAVSLDDINLDERPSTPRKG